MHAQLMIMQLCLMWAGLGSKGIDEIFITGQNKENIDRILSRYTKASRETTWQEKEK